MFAPSDNSMTYKNNYSVPDDMQREPRHDPFENELSLERISSRSALLSFFIFVVSLSTVEVKTITLVSFAAFAMASISYGVLRLKNR